MKTCATSISLDALLAVLSERIHDAGGPKKFAALHGYTANAWLNIIARKRVPTAAALELLGYEADPPRFRKIIA